MARLYLLLFIIQIALAVFALISCLSTDEEDIRGLPRLVWVLIILFFPLIGSIAWFLVGRDRETAASTGRWRTGGGFPEATRPARSVAPDDDPEFLRSLNADQSRQDQELLRRWEEDLKRREDELRDRDQRGDERPDG